MRSNCPCWPLFYTSPTIKARALGAAAVRPARLAVETYSSGPDGSRIVQRHEATALAWLGPATDTTIRAHRSTMRHQERPSPVDPVHIRGRRRDRIKDG